MSCNIMNNAKRFGDRRFKTVLMGYDQLLWETAKFLTAVLNVWKGL